MVQETTLAVGGDVAAADALGEISEVAHRGLVSEAEIDAAKEGDAAEDRRCE
jgi:hypothetical protein